MILLIAYAVILSFWFCSCVNVMSFNLKYQTKEEREYLELHKCRDSGEAYAAAYLTTREHIVEHMIPHYNLSLVNCEMASFLMMSNAKDLNKVKNGTIVQTLDVFDFSVIHLSAYERLQRKYAKFTRIDNTIAPVIKSIELLKTMTLNSPPESRFHPKLLSLLNRTVVIMPFLGSDMGAGHSDLSNRYKYLHACVWSVLYYFPHVVVTVKYQVDYDYIRYTYMRYCQVLL